MSGQPASECCVELWGHVHGGYGTRKTISGLNTLAFITNAGFMLIRWKGGLINPGTTQKVSLFIDCRDHLMIVQVGEESFRIVLSSLGMEPQM